MSQPIKNDPVKDRHNLLAIWKSMESPKPAWETFKRLTGHTRGDVQRAIDLWLRTRDR